MTSEGGISKSQLDRLGSRLRNDAEPSDDDLVMLNRYRQRFVEVERSVVAALRDLSPYPVESRHKSIPSIVAKLRRRQPARLSAIQDMAGARIIVPHSDEQDRVVSLIVKRFGEAAIDDKRSDPAFGYRAVHVVVHARLPFEIQVRTELEHAWAQLSERLADQYGFALKYGGGPQDVRSALLEYSDFAASVERLAALARAGTPDAEAVSIVGQHIERLPEILKTLSIE